MAKKRKVGRRELLRARTKVLRAGPILRDMRLGKQELADSGIIVNCSKGKGEGVVIRLANQSERTRVVSIGGNKVYLMAGERKVIEGEDSTVFPIIRLMKSGGKYTALRQSGEPSVSREEIAEAIGKLGGN